MDLIKEVLQTKGVFLEIIELIMIIEILMHSCKKAQEIQVQIISLFKIKIMLIYITKKI